MLNHAGVISRAFPFEQKAIQQFFWQKQAKARS